MSVIPTMGKILGMLGFLTCMILFVTFFELSLRKIFNKSGQTGTAAQSSSHLFGQNTVPGRHLKAANVSKPPSKKGGACLPGCIRNPVSGKQVCSFESMYKGQQGSMCTFDKGCTTSGATCCCYDSQCQGCEESE